MFSQLLFNSLSFFVYFISLVFAVTIHEFAHAYLADRLGDPTPRISGRLSLNPLVHIDLFGTILLPLFLILNNFGIFIAWAKPVVYDPFNLKNPRKDSALISIAGPTSNLIIALLVSLIIRLIFFLNLTLSPFIISFFFYFIYVNIFLAVFNILPIHPLDGFKIIYGLLNEEQAKEWAKLEAYGMLFLLLLIIPLNSSSMFSRIIKPLINFFVSLLIPSQINQII